MPLIDIYPVIARTLRAGLPAALLVLLAGSAPPHDRLASWEGRYAMDLRIGTETRVPVVGTERSVTRTLLLVDVRRDGGRWVQRQTVCDVGIQSGRVRMTVPDAFVSSMPRREYTSIVQGPGDERTYTADLGVESIGFDPRATGGTLPRNARSRGVLDSDHDGAPGATVVGHFPMFGRVRLFIAQRSHLVLHGRQTSDDRIEGRLEIRVLEQRTLGADNRLFRRTLSMRPDAENSRFVMVRTSVAECGALVRQAGQLFR